MRNAAHVFLAYGLLLLMTCLWRLGPTPGTAPNVAALSAAYLGLTAHGRVAAATACAALIGYLADLVLGTPVGLQSATCALVCLTAHLLHQRMLVRGLGLTVFFSLLAGAVAALAGLLLRLYVGLLPEDGSMWAAMGLTILMTGISGPVVLLLAGAVDRRFTRSPHLLGAS